MAERSIQTHDENPDQVEEKIIFRLVERFCQVEEGALHANATCWRRERQFAPRSTSQPGGQRKPRDLRTHPSCPHGTQQSAADS